MLRYLIVHMRLVLKLWSKYYTLRFVCALLLEAGVVYISLYLVPQHSIGSSLLWPPAAVGLGLLWFGGLELAPAIAGGFLAVLLPQGVLPPLATATALGNTLESGVAVFILREYAAFNPMFGRMRDALGLIFTAFLSSLVSATTIAFAVYLFGNSETPGALWTGLWIGHTVSILSLGPFVLRWIVRPRWSRTRLELLEGTGVFGALILITFLMAWTPYTSIGGVSLLYLDILPLIWIALRTGPRGMSLGLLLFALITTTGVLFGHGPLSTNTNLAETLFGMQMVIGTLSLIFLLFNSITEERKEAIIELESHVGALERVLERLNTEDKAKTDFIAILAHELRNPLSPILSGLELLKINLGESELLKMMSAHVHTMARLLDDLLDISRITQKKFKIQREAVEVHSVVTRALEMVAPLVQERKQELSVSLPHEELWLQADPVRLAQVLVNLLNNAAKYTDPGGTIALTVERKGAALLVRVKDSGVGITPERLKHIFEPFGTNERDNSRPGGLRIGLSLAKRMVEMHHGELTAHSLGEGKGSEFIVTIPLPPNAPLPLVANNRTRGRFNREVLGQSRKERGPLKVLVVDDNEAAAQNLARLLEHSGHQVCVAYDAPQALELLRRERPQAALVDIGLPTMDGYELAGRMREESPRIALIALTGFGQSEDKQKSIAAGFSEHLVKPVSIIDVERVLSEVTPGA